MYNGLWINWILQSGLELALNWGSYEDANTFEKTSCFSLSFILFRVQHRDYKYVLLMEVPQNMHSNVQESTCKCHFPCGLTCHSSVITVIKKVTKFDKIT